MLIDPSCIPDVIEKVKSDEFYIQANRDIFDTIFAMFSYGQSVDAVTLLAASERFAYTRWMTMLIGCRPPTLRPCRSA